MDVIQQFGAYAGLAAIVGLAVLSALYFSQARDLRRLREWASRSPERAGPARGAEAEARSENMREPAPAGSAARSGVPASIGSTQAPWPAVTALRPGAGSPASTDPGGRTIARPLAGGAAGVGAVGGAGAAAPGGPSRGADGQAGAVNGRPAERSSLPYVALAVVGLLIVLGAAAFALGLVGGRSEPAPRGASGSVQRAGPAGGALAPGQVTFSVLNGTSVDGLGKQVADELEAAGYRRGNVTNAGTQRPTSVVRYAQGARTVARSVARRLHIDRIEPADSGSQTLAGDATVIVVVGTDRTQ